MGEGGRASGRGTFVLSRGLPLTCLVPPRHLLGPFSWWGDGISCASRPAPGRAGARLPSPRLRGLLLPFPPSLATVSPARGARARRHGSRSVSRLGPWRAPAFPHPAPDVPGRGRSARQGAGHRPAARGGGSRGGWLHDGRRSRARVLARDNPPGPCLRGRGGSCGRPCPAGGGPGDRPPLHEAGPGPGGESRRANPSQPHGGGRHRPGRGGGGRRVPPARRGGPRRG